MNLNSDFKNIKKYCMTCGEPLILNCTRDIKRKKYCSHKCNSSHISKKAWENNRDKMLFIVRNLTPEQNKLKGRGGATRKGIKHSVEQCEKQSKTITQLIIDGKFNTNKYHKSGYVYNNKIVNKNNKIYFRSSYEEKFIKYVINEDKIISIKGNPFCIKLDEGKRYIPDFLIETIDNKYLIEIKPKSLLHLELNVLKFKKAHEYCEQNNLIFDIITEDHLTGEVGYPF